MVLAAQPIQPGVELAHEAELPGLFSLGPIQPGVELAHEAELPSLSSLGVHNRPWLSAGVWLSTWLSKAKKKLSVILTLSFLIW